MVYVDFHAAYTQHDYSDHLNQGVTIAAEGRSSSPGSGAVGSSAVTHAHRWCNTRAAESAGFQSRQPSSSQSAREQTGSWRLEATPAPTAHGAPGFPHVVSPLLR